MNYSYGNKKQWRRWLWNRIAERTEDRKNAFVLFLAGEDALDVAVAEQKGFQRKNMIAVERDRTTLQKLRASGLLAIEGDLLDVLAGWPQDRPIDVLCADFCCGLEMKILQSLHQVPLIPSLSNAALAFNFLRGRDSSTNPVRQALKDNDAAERNRALIFYRLCVVGCLRNVPNVDEKWQAAFDVFGKFAQPDFQSYRSTAGNQLFDTVVFKSPTRRLGEAQGIEVPAGERVATPPHLQLQVRRTAAILAHHTRRL